jgi:hypothetical protein
MLLDLNIIDHHDTTCDIIFLWVSMKPKTQQQMMSRESLEYYLSLAYSVTLDADPEGGYVSHIKDLLLFYYFVTNGSKSFTYSSILFISIAI